MKALLLTCLLAWLALGVMGALMLASSMPPLHEDTGAPAGSEVSVVTVNSSCRARLLLEVRQKMLQAMGLAEEPQIRAGRAEAVRHLWSQYLKTAAGQERSRQPNISSDQALLIRKSNCTQMSYRVILNDLGWETWVIYPELFFYTACVGCRCADGTNTTSAFEPETCGMDMPSSQLQGEQVSCCHVTTSLTPFAYLDGGRGLMLRSVELSQECRCRP